MNEIIATSHFLCVRPNGERLDVAAQLGRPYQTAAGDWACPVSLHPLQSRLVDIHGANSLQALCLAASLLRSLLRHFTEEGGAILHPREESAVELDAIFSEIGLNRLSTRGHS